MSNHNIKPKPVALLFGKKSYSAHKNLSVLVTRKITSYIMFRIIIKTKR